MKSIELEKKFNFHDSELRSIETGGSKNIKLVFVDSNGNKQGVILEDVDDFKCNNFRRGNIVFAAEEISSAELQDRDIVALDTHEEISAEEEQEVHRTARKREVARIREQVGKGELVFFRVSSSYGASIWALCKKVRWCADL